MSTAPVLSAPDTAILTHVPELSDAALSATAAARQQPAEQLYDVAATAARLAALSPQPQRIVLQFPDEALCDSVPVFWGLTRELQKREWKGQLFIGADTSYGNCCVDEVAAQHVDADMVVHYGHACLSPTQRLPVLYVFPKLAIEPLQAATALAAGVHELVGSSGADEPAPKAMLLLFDVAYAHAAPSVHAELGRQLEAQGVSTPLVLSSVECEGNTGASGSRLPDAACSRTQALGSGCGCESTCQEAPRPPPEASPEDVSRLSGSGTGVGAGRRYELPSGADLRSSAVIYLGGESLALTNLLLRLGPSSRMLSYDPRRPAGAEVRREDGRTNRLLMRRYAAVQKARDASVIALLVGTLGVAAYLPLLAHLREKLVERGRRVYTISVGKLTPAKLANYAEIDVFVLLACPENSLVDAIDATRSRDFFKPIVSPFEMLHALKDEEDGGREWSGDYVLDLDRLAPTPQTAAPSTSDAQNVSDELAAQTGDLSLTAQGSVEPTAPADGEESSDEEPQFSLITGGYVSRPKRAGKNGSGVRQIADAASAGVVMVRSADGSLTRVLDSAAGAHLAQRSWRGLETRSSDDAPSVLGRGRAGIASGYADSGGTSEGQEGVGAITREQTQAGQQ